MATTAAKDLAARLRADLGITGPRSKVRHGVVFMLHEHDRSYDMGWPHGVRTAVLGIDHAVSTGRLDHTIVDQIRALSDWRKVDLVAEIATEVEHIGDVPRYLIERFARRQSNKDDQDAMRVANRYAGLIDRAQTLQGRAIACRDAAYQYRRDARANQASAETHKQAARTIRDPNVAADHGRAARNAEAEAAREILAARYYEQQAEQYEAQR